MNSSAETRRYHAFLLRLWQTGEDESAAWLASLEDPRTGERHGFADLNSLFAFLNKTCHDTEANT